MRDEQRNTFAIFLLYLSLLLLLAELPGTVGRLTDGPKNNFVLEGVSTEFTCCSNVQNRLFWEVKPFGSKFTSDIYGISGLINGFLRSGRFSVTGGSRPECYSLTIRDVNLDDAGTFTCVDDEGLGQKLSGELVVLKSFNCQEKNRRAEYMGENKFGLPEDVFSTVCISVYFGNIPPKSICEWSSGTQLFDNHQHATETNLTTIMTIIQLPARKAFNGDQLLCYLKIDGEASVNRATTAWKSSHLIINYATFHQRGVSQCSVEDLFLDCQPPCNYKTVLFNNGSSYCEVAYPSKTHQKFFVPLQDRPTCTITLPVEAIALVSVLIGCVFGGVIAAAIIILKRKRCQRRNGAMHEMDRPMLDPDSNRGRHTISRPGIVINMGDGNTVTVNTVYGDQKGSGSMPRENEPLLKALSTVDLSGTPSTASLKPGNVLVRGAAVLGEHVFFAYRGSTKVRVYSANTLGYKKSWEMNDLTRPQDVTACSEKNCLYISNIKRTGGECEILKISPHGILIKKWDTGRNYFGRLSVTHDVNVLLAVYSNRRLVEYNPDGNRLKEIQLPDAVYPNYALKDNSGYYFVSHGFLKHHVHGVSQVDETGEVLKRFGNTIGSTNEQLNTPVHLIMNDGSIWVADSNNGRVVALSSSLKYKATLLSKEEDDLGRPLRICLDQANRRLLLSDFQNESHFLRAFNFASSVKS